MEINKLLEGKRYYISLLGSIIIIVFIFYLIKLLFFNSIIKENSQLSKDIVNLEKEYIEHINNKKVISKNLVKIKSNYTDSSKGYYLLEEIDSFYSNLSLLSSKNDLKIKKIDKKVLKIDDPQKKQNNSKGLIKTFEIYYTLEGQFKDYLNLREDLSNNNKVIIYKEEVISKDSISKKNVIINATLNVPSVEDISKEN